VSRRQVKQGCPTDFLPPLVPKENVWVKLAEVLISCHTFNDVKAMKLTTP